MKPWIARSLVAAILATVAGVWVVILHAGADPARGMGAAWFELSLGHIAASYLALLACYVILGRQAWKPRLGRAVLSVAAVILAGVLVELPAAIGLVDYRAVLFPRCMGGSGPRDRQLDPELIYRRRTHDEFVHRQAGDYAAGMAIPRTVRYRAECRYDADGFRNDEDYEQADVVLLGDSFIEGYNVTQDEIVSAHLRRILGQKVANLAMCGYGPQQELTVLKRYGLDLQPRVVVWFFYEGNDLFDLEDYDHVMADWDGYVAGQRSYAARSFFLNILEPLGFWLDQLRWHESKLALRHAGRLRPEIPGDVRVTYFGDPPWPMTDHARMLLGRMQDIFREAQAACRRRGARLLVANVPVKARVYRDLCTFSADSPVPRWQWNDLPQQLGSWCGSTGIDFTDLTVPLESAARSGRLVYLVDDPHWSAEGHAVVAEEIARAIDVGQVANLPE